MVKVSFNQKPYRKAIIEGYGGSVVASPSDLTNSGKAILEKDPNNSGSLGIAISEAVEVAATNDDTKYALGSVLNHVLCINLLLVKRLYFKWKWQMIIQISL